jgi:hypothetical protein
MTNKRHPDEIGVAHDEFTRRIPAFHNPVWPTLFIEMLANADGLLLPATQVSSGWHRSNATTPKPEAKHEDQPLRLMTDVSGRGVGRRFDLRSVPAPGRPFPWHSLVYALRMRANLILPPYRSLRHIGTRARVEIDPDA